MADELLNTDKEQSNKPWQFQPGESGNPDGRPKGSKNKISMARLEEAISAESELAEKEGGVDAVRHFVRMAYLHPNVMIALMKKFIPDKSHTELSGVDSQPININLVPVKDKKDIEKLKDND